MFQRLPADFISLKKEYIGTNDIQHTHTNYHSYTV